ncbi:hypothetical protein JTE90_027418 [Oedothorax gibbosus]|uniref:Uncharacterized protein n=1 Tax=Oedothorax gibbosus TaxID=931172 RepID=A0AAV6VY54_9ARAC|nr:hypothetical protein JTE90_027418 [Oedothorax gibbosus]
MFGSLFLYSLLTTFCNGFLYSNAYADNKDEGFYEKLANISERYSTDSLIEANKTIVVDNYVDLQQNLRKDGRTLNHLTPGEEYLLSVVTIDDAKNNQFDKLPHLMKILQKGNFDIDGKPAPVVKADERVKSNTSREDIKLKQPFPSRFYSMMETFTNLKKADNDATNTVGFFDSFASDPVNFILSTIIPLSLLLAAVVPLLTNLLMTGLYIPPIVSSIANNRGRSVEDTNSTEFFVPILESIASFGVKTFEDVTKENADETNVRFVKEALDMVTSFVNKKWLSLFGGVSQLNNECLKNTNCASK